MLRHPHDLSTLDEVPNGLNHLFFYFEPKLADEQGQVRRNFVDLRCFQQGSSVLRGQGKWSGDFQGRPGLAREFAELIALERPPETTLGTNIQGFKNFFRFLDSIDGDAKIDSVKHLTDRHGQLLKRWLKARNVKASSYRHIKAIVSKVRSSKSLSSLLWPAPDAPVLPVQVDVQLLAARRLYKAMVREAGGVKAMLREGSVLADAGHDPRSAPAGSGAWNQRDNQAWLVRQTFSEVSACSDDSDQPPRPFYFSGHPHGPEYCPPGMSERQRETYPGKLRWLTPSRDDTSVFLWLFLLATRWNLATALAIDATGQWAFDHPTKPEFKVLSAYKARAGKHQLAFSRAKPEWRPFQIVQFMIERTEPLRRLVQARLTVAKRKAVRDKSSKLAKKIGELDSLARSPWLFHSLTDMSEVLCIRETESGPLNKLARAVAERHGETLDHPDLAKWKTSHCRDAWVGHVYETSEFDIVLAAAAIQHKDASKMGNYLTKARYQKLSERRVRSVQDAAFAEINRDGPLNLTRLRLLVANGSISEEESERLLDLGMQTQVGMRCKDPKNPPRNIAPQHPKGTLCAVQRCTGCGHGAVFDDSLPLLARRLVVLEERRSKTPVASWIGSSLEAEAGSVAAALGLFDLESVVAKMTAWKLKLKDGDASKPRHLSPLPMRNAEP